MEGVVRSAGWPMQEGGSVSGEAVVERVADGRAP
jgi:hypothetical protein